MEKKHITLRKHTKKRAKERYDIELTSAEQKEIVNNIINNVGCKFIYKQSCSKSIYLVVYNKKEFLFVYDKNRKVLVTALPLKAKDKFIEKEELRLEEKKMTTKQKERGLKNFNY